MPVTARVLPGYLTAAIDNSRNSRRRTIGLPARRRTGSRNVSCAVPPYQVFPDLLQRVSVTVETIRDGHCIEHGGKYAGLDFRSPRARACARSSPKRVGYLGLKHHGAVERPYSLRGKMNPSQGWMTDRSVVTIPQARSTVKQNPRPSVFPQFEQLREQFAAREDEAAIEIMLAGSANTHSRNELLDVGHELRSIDRNAREEHGMERRIRSELENRLRLYRDVGYRTKLLRIYRERVRPRATTSAV